MAILRSYWREPNPPTYHKYRRKTKASSEKLQPNYKKQRAALNVSGDQVLQTAIISDNTK